MFLKQQRKINFKPLSLSFLAICLIFFGTVLVFNLFHIPTAYSQTSNAWNLQRDASNGLKFFYSLSGPNALYLTSSGNAGIGTTAPQAQLHIGSLVANSKALMRFTSCSVESCSGNRTWEAGVSNDQVGFNQFAFRIEDTYTTKPGLRLLYDSDTSGIKVGIGTVAPLTPLHIVRAGGTPGIMFTDDSANQYRTTIRPDFSGNTPASNTLKFLLSDGTVTGQVTVMTLTGSGGVGIGTTAPSEKLHVGGGVTAGHARIDGRVGINGYGVDGCGANFGLCVGGQSGGQSIWNNTSDVRLKKNITTIPNALEKVMALRGVYFDFKDMEGVYKTLPKSKQVGFIAQEVETTLPEVVTTGEDGMKMLGYGSITALLTEAIKEQQLEIEQLKLELEQLKNK